MNYIPNRNIEDMLKNADPQSRKVLSNILTGKISVRIYCLSESCDGKMIGQVYNNGMIEPVRDDEGNMWLRSTRKRLDGATGCQCWCGQDSLLSAQEAGHVTDSAPTKEGLSAIFDNIQKNPTVTEEIDGRVICDGFAFEEVK